MNSPAIFPVYKISPLETVRPYAKNARTHTTIIAAEMTGRACHAIEISPTYVDTAILRWQNFTGQQATHINGTPFGAAHG